MLIQSTQLLEGCLFSLKTVHFSSLIRKACIIVHPQSPLSMRRGEAMLRIGKLAKIPALLSQNVINKSCLVCFKSEK